MYNAHAREPVDAARFAQPPDFQGPMIQVTVLRVALDMPLRRIFDYLPPQRTRSDDADSGAASRAAQPIQPGMRVRVPFGRQRLVGVVVGWGESSDIPAERLKPVLVARPNHEKARTRWGE